MGLLLFPYLITPAFSERILSHMLVSNGGELGISPC